MIRELLQTGLWIGGGSLVALCVASFWIPKALGWRRHLENLPPLMRELWWTYALYIWGSHAFFAVLCLGFGDWLLGRTGPAAAMAGFMGLWWSVRLWLQFFGFDFSGVLESRANHLAKHLLTLLFIGLVVLFGGLVAWNIGWLEQGGPR
jgi:hypothetical protein